MTGPGHMCCQFSRKGSELGYRPVSLTSVPCKVQEKLVNERVVEQLKNNQILSQQQHGFRAKMSCLTQLLEYTFDPENALDEGDCVDAAYLESLKVFDSVPHGHLLCKLRGVGIESQVLEWISFFGNRGCTSAAVTLDQELYGVVSLKAARWALYCSWSTSMKMACSRQESCLQRKRRFTGASHRTETKLS